MSFDWIHRHRASILITTAIVLVLCALGIPNLTISPDNRVFYGKSNSYFNDFLEFEADYTSNNNILFVLSSKNKVQQHNYPNAIRWVTDRAWLIDNVIRVDSLSTYPHAISKGDEVTVSTLLDYTCPKGRRCNADAETTLLKREIVNRLVSNDLHSTGILATLTLKIGSVGGVETINKQARDLVAEFSQSFPDYELIFTGGIPMMAAFAEATAADLNLLLPIAIVAIFCLLYWFLGSVKPTLILFTLGIVAIIVTMGLAGWDGHVVNNATSIVPLIVFTLVITSSMHVLLHFQRAAEGAGDRKAIVAASKAALENNIPPVVTSAVTSIVGLMSLSFVDSPPLQQLGQLSAIGVGVGCALSLTILPISLASLKANFTSPASRAIQFILNRYARYIESERTFAIAGFFLFIVLLAGVPRIEIDDDFVEYFDTSTSFRTQTDRATELLAGPNHIEILVSSGAMPDGVFNPEHLNATSRLAEHLRLDERVSNVHSFYDLIQDVVSAFAPGTTVGALSSSQIAQWFLVYELSLQQGQSNTDYVNRAQTESRISVLLNETSSRDIQNLESDIDEWHKLNIPNVSLRVTGENIPVAHISELNIRSMIFGIGGSIVLASLVVAGAFRKFRLGVAALISILIPVLGGFGIWGWTVGSIGLASTAIVALTIGVVVDDTVHIAYRYLDGTERLNLSPWQSSAYSIHRAGTAIVTTSIVMLGGLAALLFSAFEVNSSFGACTCLIIALALLFDMLVLPRILVWTGR